VGLRPLACWDCGFEAHEGHGCLSVVIVVCCQVDIIVMYRSLVQRSPTLYMCVCVVVMCVWVCFVCVCGVCVCGCVCVCGWCVCVWFWCVCV
jgi:hypothetical protein